MALKGLCMKTWEIPGGTEGDDSEDSQLVWV